MPRRPKQFQRKDITKDAQIPLRVTTAEKELLEQKAADCGMSTSAYLLKCGLGKPVRSKVAATIINELRGLGQQQKDLYQAGGGEAFALQYNEILKALVGAIERVAAGELKGE